MGKKYAGGSLLELSGEFTVLLLVMLPTQSVNLLLSSISEVTFDRMQILPFTVCTKVT